MSRQRERILSIAAARNALAPAKDVNGLLGAERLPSTPFCQNGMMNKSDLVQQPILLPASRDELILAALNQIAADIRAIRVRLESNTSMPAPELALRVK